MPYARWFSGSTDAVQPCEPRNHYWVIYPLVHVHSKARHATTTNVNFSVAITGGPTVTVTTDANEGCFTLVFNDANDYTAVVSHTTSGFAAPAVSKSSAASNGTSKVTLTKSSALTVTVQEKWPDGTKNAFAGASVAIGASTAAADVNGQRALALTAAATVHPIITGLVVAKCVTAMKVVYPAAAGFLAARTDLDTTLDAAATVDVPDEPGATVTVTFTIEVNLILPKIEGDPLVLVDCGDAAHKTTAAQLTTKLDTTYALDVADCAELRATLDFDDKIECFTDAQLTTAYPAGSSRLLNKLATVYVKGKKTGECKPKFVLRVSTEVPRPAANRTWRIKADSTWRDPSVGEAEGSIVVEKLELGVFTYRDALDDDAAVVTAAPKKRELHNQNGTTFTVARLTVKKPTDLFWTKATAVRLDATGSCAVYADAACTNALSTLAQAAFVSDPLPIWVKGTGPATLDAEPNARVDWNAWRTKKPEKDVVDAGVSLGATVAGKALSNGDHVKLETYGYDRYVDRLTRNRCGTWLNNAYRTPAYLTLTDLDVAVALAGAHRYYNNLSGYHVNKNYKRDGSTIWGAFVSVIAASRGAVAKAAAGADFVETHLLNEHGIVLHATTKGLIRSYMQRLLAGGFHFDAFCGVPGVHAEVLAVNEILTAGIAVTRTSVATYKLQGGDVQGRRFVACANCAGILKGGADKVRVITG